MIKKFLHKNKEAFTAYAYILPAILAFIVFMFYPFFRTIYLSFLKWNLVSPNKQFVGLKNYITVFQSPITYKVIGNTFVYIVVLLILNWVAPYILSFILSIIIKRGKNFYKAAFFLPSVISMVVGAMLYTWILNPVSGPVAIIAKRIGLTMPIWSTTQGLVIVVLSLIGSWKIFGYNFIVVFAGVSGVSSEVIEVAKTDNIPSHKIFLDIVLPMSSATGIYVFIITIVQGLQYMFTPIKVITMGGPNNASANMIYYSYNEAFLLFRTGVSSAFSIITMVLFVFLLILEFKFVEKKIYYEN